MHAQFDFNAEVVAHRDSLRYYAYSLTNNSEETNDLVQETLLKAFTYRDKFTDHTNLKAWLFTIMKNIFINNYRRSIKTRTIIDGTKDLYFVNIPQSRRDTNDPESTFSCNEIYARLEQLSEDFKKPLKMYFEGFKYKEIADDMDLPIGTVKSRIFLARKQMAQMFQEV